MTPDELHKERGETHGDYREQFDIAQRLKGVVALRVTQLHPVQREALDMIFTKVSRIVVGDSNEHDHWEDIAGYAMLPAKMLREPTPKKTTKIDGEYLRRVGVLKTPAEITEAYKQAIAQEDPHIQSGRTDRT